MRGDDRSSRYPPRGVWFGLILAAGTVRALLAQDVPAEDDSRRLADPVVLAANRVTQWQAAGAIWVRLAGQASVLQPVDGIRAGCASSGSPTTRPASKRLDEWKSTPRETCAYRVPRVQPTGVSRRVPDDRGASSSVMIGRRRLTVSDPPWDLAIIRRSGFLAAKPAGAGQTGASGQAQPGGGQRRGPGHSLVSASPCPPGAGRSCRRKPSRPIPGRRPTPGKPVPPAQRPRSSGGTEPSRDPMVQRSRLCQQSGSPRERCPARRRPRSTRRFSRPARPQVPNAGAQPPEIDLPPIEGAGAGPEAADQSRRPTAEHRASARARWVGRRSRATANGPGGGGEQRRQDRSRAAGRADHRRLSDHESLRSQRAAASDRATPDHA